MKTGPLGIALIKEFESLHDGDLSLLGLQPKMCPAGIWTEGYGHAMIDPKTGKFLKGETNRARAYALHTVNTEKEAMTLLLQDLGVYERIVAAKVDAPLTQNQFDALVSHTYNTGGSNTLFDLVEAKAGYDKINIWFTTRYTQANGVTMKGLVRRRNAEAKLFFTK